MDQKLLILFGTLTLGIACKENDQEDEKKFDMFPLVEGNEFFYTYSFIQHGSNGYYVKGKEKWKVVSENSANTNITRYDIEAKLDGICVRTYEAGPFNTKDIDTTYISDSTWHFFIEEEHNIDQISFTLKSSYSNSDDFFWNILLNRHKIYETETTIYLSRSMDWNATYTFLPDHGLSKYYLIAGSPNFFEQARESLIQDSVKLND